MGSPNSKPVLTYVWSYLQTSILMVLRVEVMVSLSTIRQTHVTRHLYKMIGYGLSSA